MYTFRNQISAKDYIKDYRGQRVEFLKKHTKSVKENFKCFYNQNDVESLYRKYLFKTQMNNLMFT